MTNRYPAMCYRCGGRCEIGEGRSERFKGGWRTQHASCALLYRDKPEDGHVREYAALAQGVGPAARRARAKLRRMEDAGGR